MRYSADRKAETRRRLITTAGALAKKDGFATTGVDGLMASVNLTGGAFYSHFSSKDELLNEIIARELNSSRELLLRLLEEEPLKALQNFSAYYFSPMHVHHPEIGCALPSLSSEVARADDSIKQTYQTSVQAIQKVLADVWQDDSAAWATLALSVGAVVIARAMATPEAQQQLLDACRQFSNNSLQSLAQKKFKKTTNEKCTASQINSQLLHSISAHLHKSID